MSVLLKDGTQRIPQLIMPRSKRMMIPEESTGIFRRATPRFQRAKECVCRLEPFVHAAASTKTKKETQHKDVFSQKGGSVAAHLRGMRSTRTAKKDPLMLLRNSNFFLLLLNFHYNCIMYFNC